MLEVNLNEDQGRQLKIMLEAIERLNVNVVRFDFSLQEGLLIQAFGNNVMLVEIRLPPAWFHGYTCTTQHTVSLNLELMITHLKCWGYEDLTTIRIEDQGDTICFIFRDNVDNAVFSQELKVLPDNLQRIQLYGEIYPAIVEMSSNLFATITRNMIRIDDSVLISVVGEQQDFGIVNVLRFAPVGEHLARETLARETLTYGNSQNGIQITRQDNVETHVRLRTMRIFAKASNLSENVIIKLDNRSHILLEYHLPEDGVFRFYVSILN